MGAWAYYSPLMLGALLVVAMNEPLRESLPVMSEAAQWGWVSVVAVLVAIQSQVLMFGAQGVFAQVLPVPRGRSVRGRGAVLAGGLLIAWVGLSGVAVLLGVEEVSTGARVLGVSSVLALGGAVLVYVWELPTAVADFGMKDR